MYYWCRAVLPGFAAIAKGPAHAAPPPDTDREPPLPSSAASAPDLKRCPACAEWIQELAVICRFCRTELSGKAPGSAAGSTHPQ
jgi:hypothetical protein